MAAARIVVVGGSLGGLFAANLLLRAGHRVTLLEKATQSLDGRGAGIVTHGALLQALQAAGAVVDETLGVAVQSRVALAADGTIAARLDYPQILTSWSRLFALLNSALPAECYLSGHEVAAVDSGADGVSVCCTNGQRFNADLLIASDGIRSVVRSGCAPTVRQQYAGYVAWRGVCDESVLSAFARKTLFEFFGFGLPEGEQIIGYPVAGAGNNTRPGSRRYNFVWYRPAAESDALCELLTDADGVLHRGGISPNQVSWREIARMRAASRELLAPQWAEVVEKTAQPFIQPIYDLMSERLAFDRIALMGDAGFVARPHVGMGVTKAAEDAVSLTRSIAEHGATPLALRAYEAERLQPGRDVVARARSLGSYLEATAQASGPNADMAPRRDMLGVLADTASDLRSSAERQHLSA